MLSRFQVVGRFQSIKCRISSLFLLTISQGHLIPRSLFSVLRTNNSMLSPSQAWDFSDFPFCGISSTFCCCCSTLIPASQTKSASKSSCDEIGPTQTIQENLPILKFIIKIISAKSLLPCNISDSKFPGIRMWTSLGSHY